ncbi:MAG: betaine--homocysteine S-methyltransferase [Cohaesibacter sp.]|nr:betaine--homocysteine S-methyltransferase [Cohaesibacter sp.]
MTAPTSAPNAVDETKLAKIKALIAEKGALLADGATGTNLFPMGLASGWPPEEWNETQPDKIRKLHQGFVDAGSDIILTNSFGGNRHRLKLHHFQGNVAKWNILAVQLAREVAQSAKDREVLVAGSIGPTGELFVPMGKMTHDEAVDSFREQAEALKEGGVDLLWIETMSSPEEIAAAAEACASTGLPFTITASFDSAGRTMMGMPPEGLGELAEKLTEDLGQKPFAIGSNCGVGASDLLVAILALTKAYPDAIVIAKANCGIPEIKGDKVVYTGTPDLMGKYMHMALDAGASIVGGCCGTSPDHLVAMRKALDSYVPSDRPSLDQITEEIGFLMSPPRDEADIAKNRRGGRGRRGRS